MFHIFPKTPVLRAPTPLEGEIGAQLLQVGAADRTLRRGQSTALAAKVHTGGRDVQGACKWPFTTGTPSWTGN